MKYGAIATNPFERLALGLGKVPLPLIDSVYGPIKARALLTGVQLGVFEAMRDGWHTPEALAATLQLDANTLELLLRVLAYSDYLEQDGDRYALAAAARRSLVRGSPMDLTGCVAWNKWMWDMIGALESVVRTGRGVDYHATLEDPAAWAAYQRGMLEIARLDAPVVTKHVPVPPGATRLLDLAGSHGFFGAALCRRHAGLRATVLDLPGAIEPARALAREAGIDDVVEHRAGDLLTDDLGHDWNVVLLNNILHHFEPETIAAITRRVHAALGAGGSVAIWDLERPRRGSKPTEGDGAALFFRITSTAGCYHGDEYAGWLEQAGFTKVRVQRPALSPGNILVTAMR
jgi:hypothetical protein